MRGLRTTIALVVVLGGLFAYIYFVTWKQPAEEAGPKQEKVFASIESDKIEELRIKSDSGDTSALKKEKDGWRLIEPLAIAAADSEVSGITSALSQLEIVRVVDDKPANLNDYGLASPRIEVDFKAAGGRISAVFSSAKIADRRKPVRQASRRDRVFLIRVSGADVQPGRSIFATRRSSASNATRLTASPSTPPARRSRWPRRAATGGSRSRWSGSRTPPQWRDCSDACCRAMSRSSRERHSRRSQSAA